MTAPGVERGRETILIVEDDQMVRPLVVRQIESLCYVALTSAMMGVLTTACCCWPNRTARPILRE
jgi:hypothetical protein